MFSELPKLFDRNFAIAYFLPVSLFMVVSTWLLNSFGYWSNIATIFTGNTLFDATLAVFAAWIVGILLLVLNREIYRILEGYGNYNPLKLFESRTQKNYKKKVERLDWLDENFASLTAEQRSERTKLMKELVKSFPDQEGLILPTAFGNVLRAFEVYPRVMYGFEGIDGWPRIQAVLPKDYRELIEDAKAQVDWWVNLGVMSFLFLIEFWYVVFAKWGLTPAWYITMLNILLPLATYLLLNLVLSSRATSAAIGWGDYVKSAFDIYRFALLESLGIDAPKNREEERKLWTRFSQAILFNLPESLPELNKPTKKPVTRKNK
jgi:hypothetical protein